jgi:uncharacterized protein (TIGR00251 family)
MMLHIQVKAGKWREKVELKNGQWVISINAPAAEGKANARLLEFLSEALNISKSSMKITKGHTAPFKTIEINHPENLILDALQRSI